MNGAHDMGGMHGMGPIELEPGEPVFHERWESRVLALNLAMNAWRKWNIDQSRFARENVTPAKYLSSKYYERMAYGLEAQLIAAGLIGADEIEQRMSEISAGGD